MEFLPDGKSFFLPPPIVNRLDDASRALLLPDNGRAIDFSEPKGESAFAPPDSVSWRIFKNPVSLFIGGVAAVILELAEPRVRTGVWEHSGFRNNPIRRLKRTGLAAMLTVYGPRSAAEEMIANVRRMHSRVEGVTPAGQTYAANDPVLLNWVHATAAFGFLQAYDTYAAAVSAADRDRYYREGGTAAKLYGVTEIATSARDIEEMFSAMQASLEPSPILFEFLEIMRRTPVLPAMLRPIQPLLIRAAVSITPPEIRGRLGLPGSLCLKPWQSFLVRKAGSMADRIPLKSSPAVQSCLRLGLPADYLYHKI